MTRDPHTECDDFFCNCPPDSVRVSLEIVSTCGSCRGLASVHLFDIAKDEAAQVVGDLVEFMAVRGYPPKTFLLKDLPHKLADLAGTDPPE